MQTSASGAETSPHETRPGPQRWAAGLLVAIAIPMLPRRPSLTEPERVAIDAELEQYLCIQVFSMPRYLLLPYMLALFAFDFAPCLAHGRRFRHLPVASRGQVIDSWSNSRISPMRDLLKLVRNCALYFYLDHNLVRRRLEEESEAPNG